MNHEQRGAALLQIVMGYGTFNWVTFLNNNITMMCKTHYDKRLQSFIVMPHACIQDVQQASSELMEYPVDDETLATITTAVHKNVALEVSIDVDEQAELLEFVESVCAVIIK
jgi:hypothetical protein